jgi:hypothetical protein
MESEKEKAGRIMYNLGIEAALSQVERAREEGEQDMRQVRHWIQKLMKDAK